MDRQIYKVAKNRTRSMRRESVDESDSGAYLERLFKLIPGETVALYLFLEGILRSSLNEPNQENSLTIWLWSIFTIVGILNILYLRRVVNVHDFAQLSLLTIAYVVWILTIGGPFETIEDFPTFIGPITLGLFTFIVPIFYLGKETPKIASS